MYRLLTAISNICRAVRYTININWSRYVRSIIVESMCTRKHLSQLSLYRREKNGKARSCLSFFFFFFFSYTAFLHSLSSVHLRRCPRVKVQQIPVMDICSDFRYRWVIRFSVSGQRAFTYPDSFSNIFIPAMCRARGIHVHRVYLGFLIELINCIKRTRSTTLCVRFSLLRIRINYSGTI